MDKALGYEPRRCRFEFYLEYKNGLVGELVDPGDLKSLGPKGPCRSESGQGYKIRDMKKILILLMMVVCLLSSCKSEEDRVNEQEYERLEKERMERIDREVRVYRDSVGYPELKPNLKFIP